MNWRFGVTPFEKKILHLYRLFARYFGNLLANPAGSPPVGSAYANTVDMKLYVWNGTSWIDTYNLTGYRLLLETGDVILLETGDKMLKE